MNDIFKGFDTYSLKARVFPALIAGLPTLALLFVIVPWNDFGLSQVIATAMGFVLLFAFADVARRRGKIVEAKLGTNSTPELWHRSDTVIASGTKDRYRNFIAKQLKLTAPTQEEEAQNPQKANDFYMAAGNLIRERTRDQRQFAILFSENVTYGFRRNLLGLKLISLSFNGLVIITCLAVLHFRPLYTAEIDKLDEKLVIVIIAALLHSIYMLFAVNTGSLREASRTYGRQMILSCETLMKASAATTQTANRGKGNANS